MVSSTILFFLDVDVFGDFGIRTINDRATFYVASYRNIVILVIIEIATACVYYVYITMRFVVCLVQLSDNVVH